MSVTQTPPPARPGSLRSRIVRPTRRRFGIAAGAVDATAPLFDHLDELRRRVLWSAVFFFAAFGVCYWQIDHLFHALAEPLDDKYPIQSLGVTEPFFTSLSIAAQAGFALVTPVAAWHVWRFIRPAIDPAARRTVGLLLLIAPALFTAGVAFGYFIVLEPAVTVLLGLGPSDLEVVVRAADYYSFVTMLLLALGLTFCFPLALLGLARIGVLTAAKLRTHRRLAVIGIFILAALLPTVDPISLLLEVVPLLLLYEISIIAIVVQERRIAKRAAAEEAIHV